MYTINNIVIITFIYKHRIDISYNLSINYQFNEISMKAFIFNHLALSIIYIYYPQFTIKNNISYLYQPFHHCISFEFVLIVWHHCGEL